jgi:hypothetical protein
MASRLGGKTLLHAYASLGVFRAIDVRQTGIVNDIGLVHRCVSLLLRSIQ